jgi:hypothetical protein
MQKQNIKAHISTPVTMDGMAWDSDKFNYSLKQSAQYHKYQGSRPEQ